MQCCTLLGVAVLGTVACFAQGRIARAGPAATLDGSVIAFETGAPISSAEVCVFGADTTCVRADANGRYRARVAAGVVTIRFRTPGSPPAVVRGVELAAGTARRLSCAMSSRVSLADEAACLTAP